MPVAGSTATFRIFSGIVVGDLFDLHPAFGRGHDGDAGGGAVQQQAQIQLALDVAAFLDVEALHFLAGGSGLLGHKHLAQHFAGIGRHVGDRLDDADAALPFGIVLETAGAPTARMDLGLHDPNRTAQLVGDLLGFRRAEGNSPARYDDAVALEQGLCLILMDIH